MGVPAKLKKTILHLTCIFHVFSEALGSVLCIVLFPYYCDYSFWHLDVVESLSLSSLAVMLISGEVSTGWINGDNCVLVCLLALFFICLLLVSFVGLIRKQKWALRICAIIYALDIAYLCTHYFVFVDLIDIRTRGAYFALSFLYKVIGIVLLVIFRKYECSDQVGIIQKRCSR